MHFSTTDFNWICKMTQQTRVICRLQSKVSHTGSGKLESSLPTASCAIQVSRAVPRVHMFHMVQLEANPELRGVVSSGANVLPQAVIEDAFSDQYGKTLNFRSFQKALSKLNSWCVPREAPAARFVRAARTLCTVTRSSLACALYKSMCQLAGMRTVASLDR